MRRDPNDKEWKLLKKRVSIRDKGKCRLIKILDFKEYLMLRTITNNQGLNILDPAHVFPVSLYPWMCYLDDNVILLNRKSHDWIDSGLSPITGKNISKEELEYFWIRIIGQDLYNKLKVLSKSNFKE